MYFFHDGPQIEQQNKSSVREKLVGNYESADMK